MVSTTTRLAPVDGIAQADEKALEIVFAGFGDLGALDLDVIDGELLLGDQLLDVVVKRTDVLDEVLRALFERQEHARLVVLDRAVVKEGHGEQGLAAPRRAAQQGRPALRQAALSNIIEAANAGRRFAYRGQIAGLRARRTGHEEIFLWTQLQRPAWAGRNNRLPHLP